MVSVLKHIQALIYHPKDIFIPYIKAANALLHQILPLLPYEPILAARLQQILMENLLKSL